MKAAFSGFNSIMVRLEGDHIEVFHVSDLVSIPLWFDWKSTMANGFNKYFGSFNSIMVRLEVLWILQKQFTPQGCFNSIMVRLEGRNRL